MATKKARGYSLSLELLTEYRDAACANAQELIASAALLLQAGHHARAYFLAVAAIEELGKAVMAHDGMGKNLSSSAVCARLQTLFEDHAQKVTYAFNPWLIATPDLRTELNDFVTTMLDVKLGREPSMYTDIDPSSAKVIVPSEVVRHEAAKNCVALALAVLGHAKSYLRTSVPKVTTRKQDAFFVLKHQTFMKMANTEDLWEFCIARLKAGDRAYDEIFIDYHDRYFVKGVLFKPPADPEKG